MIVWIRYMYSVHVDVHVRIDQHVKWTCTCMIKPDYCTMYSLDQLAQAMPIMVQRHTVEYKQRYMQYICIRHARMCIYINFHMQLTSVFRQSLLHRVPREQIWCYSLSWPNKHVGSKQCTYNVHVTTYAHLYHNNRHMHAPTNISAWDDPVVIGRRILHSSSNSCTWTNK